MNPDRLNQALAEARYDLNKPIMLRVQARFDEQHADLVAGLDCVETEIANEQWETIAFTHNLQRGPWVRAAYLACVACGVDYRALLAKGSSTWPGKRKQVRKRSTLLRGTTQARWKVWRHMHDAGWAAKEIARAFGTCHSSVVEALKKMRKFAQNGEAA